MSLKSFKVVNEQFKKDFLDEYGMKWDADKALFTQYVIARYHHTQADIMAQAVNAFGNDLGRIRDTMSNIAGTLERWPKK